MNYTKTKVKLFQITGITANSIKHVTYKIPREFIKLTGIQTVCFLAPGIKLHPIDCAKLTINLNDKAVNPIQRYPVNGIRNWGYKDNNKRYLPVSVNEEVRAGSIINASLEDLGISKWYPYKVTVYLHGIVQKESIK